MKEENRGNLYGLSGIGGIYGSVYYLTHPCGNEFVLNSLDFMSKYNLDNINGAILLTTAGTVGIIGVFRGLEKILK